jgi:hypothetical protein
MAQERPTTPEKQLLDLIEDPKERDLSQKKIKRSSFSLVSLAALKGRLSFLLESVQSGALFKRAFLNIKGANKILKVFMALLLVYLVGNFTMSIIRLNEIPEFVTRKPRTSSGTSLADLSTKQISDYLEGPRSRNIFKFGDIPEEEAPKDEKLAEVAAPVEVTLSKAELLSQQLGLVGIGWSDNPDVMLKNMDSGKMYFLKRGERIEGLIKVEAIFQDKVILTFDDGKELELR